MKPTTIKKSFDCLAFKQTSQEKIQPKREKQKNEQSGCPKKDRRVKYPRC